MSSASIAARTGWLMRASSASLTRLSASSFSCRRTCRYSTRRQAAAQAARPRLASSRSAAFLIRYSPRICFTISSESETTSRSDDVQLDRLLEAGDQRRGTRRRCSSPRRRPPRAHASTIPSLGLEHEPVRRRAWVAAGAAVGREARLHALTRPSCRSGRAGACRSSRRRSTSTRRTRRAPPGPPRGGRCRSASSRRTAGAPRRPSCRR